MAGVLAIAACGNDAPQNPELLRGGEFTTEMNGVTVTLKFDPNDTNVYGRVVNSYRGTYNATGNKITFSPFASTMMMGPADAMNVERDYFDFMTKTKSYRLKDNSLTIKGTDGREIVFQKLDIEPTEK